MHLDGICITHGSVKRGGEKKGRTLTESGAIILSAGGGGGEKERGERKRKEKKATEKGWKPFAYIIIHFSRGRGSSRSQTITDIVALRHALRLKRETIFDTVCTRACSKYGRILERDKWNYSVAAELHSELHSLTHIYNAIYLAEFVVPRIGAQTVSERISLFAVGACVV